MLKVLGYIVLVMMALIYLISSSTELTEKIATQKIASSSIFRSDKYRYGDLYDLSYLPEYRIPANVKSVVDIAKCNSAPNTNLYAICDSYFFNYAADKRFFCGVDQLFYARINYYEKLSIKLDSEKRNILLIELSERNLRLVLEDTAYCNNILSTSEINVSKRTEASFLSKVSGFLFNKSINTNLEMNIWDFSVFTPIKELKANLNYKLFSILDENVIISPDKKQLLYKPTIDTLDKKSSFQFISDDEVKSIVETLNGIYNTSKKLGFNEVYLAVIPNPVSVLYPEYRGWKYNQLLSRVQNSSALKLTVVDIYSDFKNSNLPIYLKSDTHWSQVGAYTWINKFNDIINKSSNNSLNY